MSNLANRVIGLVVLVVLLIAGALSAVSLIKSARAQDSTMMMLGYGSSRGGVVSSCGTGAINLSTGCTQPMLGGL